MDILDKFDRDWSTLKEALFKLCNEAAISYEQMKPLIIYFEAEAINLPVNGTIPQNQLRKCFTYDYHNLKSKKDEMIEAFKRVEKIKEDGLIDDVEKMTIAYDAFDKTLKDSGYLAKITEDTIYDAYKDSIMASHTKKFENFN